MPTPYDDCLNEAVLADIIGEKDRDQFQKAFAAAEAAAKRLGETIPDGNVLGQRALAQLMQKVGESKVDLARNVMRLNRLTETVEQTSVQKMPGWMKKLEANPIYRGLEAVLGERIRGWGTEVSLVEQRQAARLTMDSILSDFLDKVRSRTLGLTRDRISPLDLAMEVFGKDSGNPAAKLHAKAWSQAMDVAVDMLQEQGVRVRKLENYLPQVWNSGKLHDMGRDNFIEAMMDRWRRGAAKFRDWDSADPIYFIPGEDDAKVMTILAGDGKDKPGMFGNITTHGDAGIQIGLKKGETMTDRYNKRRVVEWANPQAYFDFLDTFGNGREHLGEDLIRYKNGLADDIGTARVLGNRPNEMVGMLMDWGRKTGKMSDGQVNALEKTWFHASGEASSPANVAIANMAQSVRLWLSGAQLHSAALGSVPDYAFMRSVATFNGLDPVRLMGQYLKGMDRRQAMQLGLLVQDGIRGMRDHAGEQFTANGAAVVAGHAAEMVMRGTGLDAHTVMGRTAIGREFLATLADTADKKWADLPPLNRHFLERYAIDEGDWNILRTKGMSGERLYMDPATVAATESGQARSAAMKLLGAIDAESARGMNEGSLATRAMMLGRTHPGEFAGELRRSLQYKGFSMSVMLKSGWRMMDSLFDQSGLMPRGRYVAGLAIEATILGAFSLQLKNLAAGKDLESMETANFWAKAGAQGGAGGMLGDYVKTMWQTRSADDAARMLTPTAGLMVDTYALTTGNAAQWWEAENTNFPREAVRYGRKYLMPRFWMTNLAVDRMGWDTLQRMEDPAASRAFQRLQQQLQKNTGQHYFSPPGSDFSAMRMPEMSRPLP